MTLEYCPRCIQMTNHSDRCKKCGFVDVIGVDLSGTESVRNPNKTNNYLSVWEKHTNLLVQKFVDDNFPESEWDWVAGEIGNVFEVNGFYFSLDNVVQFIKNECTPEQVLAYYDYALDIATNNLGPKIPEPTLNIKNWKKIMGKSYTVSYTAK